MPNCVVGDNENDARLRETLRMYLAWSRAVARRGREIGSDRLEVELALLACHWYGPGVLQPK
jgi:hypothetical protein